MSFIKSAVIAVLSTFAAADAADAHRNFPPFENLLLKADLATEAGMAAWQEQWNEANFRSLVYIDWHLQNFMTSDLFDSLAATNASDDDACAALRTKTGKLALRGRVNPQDNNQLARITLDLDKLPSFTLFECEQVKATGSDGIRIRGFFYAPDHEIATATETGLMPLAVEPSRLPADFFRH